MTIDADASAAQRPVAVRPRDAATLILIDFKGKTPKVLMGRRNSRHSFMPDKFVFPGGRVEPSDRQVNVAGALHPVVEDRLLSRTQRPSPMKARALALAAIRETFEETGLMYGAADMGAPKAIVGTSWAAFSEASIYPALDGLHFVARAITPPGHPRRFDTRFFLGDAAEIAGRVEGTVGPDHEFTEIVWIGLDQAKSLDLPKITAAILDEVKLRLEGRLALHIPVPFFFQSHGRYVREII